MANDLNQCTFIGRFGKDPELKYFPSGDAVVNTSIACGKSWNDKQSGEKREVTTWVPLVFTGKPAEVIAQYCKKGSQIYVSGEFTVRKWTDKDGNDKYQTEVRVMNFQLIGGKADGAGGGQAAAPAQRPAAAPRPAASGFDDADDSIPF